MACPNVYASRKKKASSEPEWPIGCAELSLGTKLKDPFELSTKLSLSFDALTLTQMNSILLSSLPVCWPFLRAGADTVSVPVNEGQSR